MLEEACGDRCRGLGYLFGGAGGYHLTSSSTTFGSHVDHVVGTLDDVHIMLNHDNRVALIDKSVENTQEHFHVLEVQTRRWLIKDIDRLAGVLLGQLTSELHALAFPTRQGVRGREDDDGQAL